MIDVVVVDDNSVVRAVVAEYLSGQDEVRVVGEAEDGRAGRDLVRRLRPHVTLLDYRMPVADGLSVAAHLVALTRVLVLTSDDSPDVIAGMLRAGAAGYLVWGQFAPTDLLRAIGTVARGGAWLSPAAASVATSALREQDARERRARARADRQAQTRSRYGLSEREQEVLDLLTGGLPNSDIAQRLDLAEKTVKNHLHHIYAKLGVRSRTQAVLLWSDHDA